MKKEKLTDKEIEKNISDFLKNNIYYSIYVLVFIVLKPLITFFAYPKVKSVVQNLYAPKREWIFESKNEPLGFHLEEYFDYHNEAFLFSLILTVILFLFFDRKNLLKK